MPEKIMSFWGEEMPICLRADLSQDQPKQFPKKKGEKRRTGLRRNIFALEIRQKTKGCQKNKLEI